MTGYEAKYAVSGCAKCSQIPIDEQNNSGKKLEEPVVPVVFGECIYTRRHGPQGLDYNHGRNQG